MFDFYIQHEYWFAAVQLVLAMMGMGATLTMADFREIIIEPKAVSSGLGIQIILVPLVALCCINVLNLDGGIAVGLALIAAIPGGAVSNIFTHFAKGNTALSISITAITTLACLVTTPLILQWLIAPYMPADFDMPAARIALEIGLFLLLPLGVGMLFLQWLPNYAHHFSQLCIRGSLFVIVLIVVGSLGAGRLDFVAFGLVNMALVGGFILLLAVLARPICGFLQLTKPDIVAIEMEVVVRSINLGLLIKASLFPAVGDGNDLVGNTVLFTLLFFGGLQLAGGAVLIGLQRHRH